jgi:hypothetical protein
MRLTAEMYDQILRGLKSDSHGGKDKRREPRVGMAGEADLVTVGDDGKRAAGKVRVRDISATGVGLTFTRPMTKGQRFVIQLESSKGEPVWLVCLTVYCRAGIGSFSIGGRIKQVLRADEITKIEAHTAMAVAAAATAHPAACMPEAMVQSDIARISKAILE